MSTPGISASDPAGASGPPAAVLYRDAIAPSLPVLLLSGDPVSPHEAPVHEGDPAGVPVLRQPVGYPSDGSATDRAAPTAFRGDFATLLQAVRSDDVSAAQRALSVLKIDVPSAKSTYSPTGLSKLGSNQAAVRALIEAVRRGSASAAKAALVQLENDALRLGAWKTKISHRPK